MAKTQTVYTCQQCGYQSPKWIGRCPDCGTWASLVEEVIQTVKKGSVEKSIYSSSPVRITEITASGAKRTSCGISEFDRTLGGGLVDGSLVLIGGDPGIGKSTLLIQVANHLSCGAGRVLYISGEESTEQIKLRSNRMGISSPELFLLSETNISAITEFINQTNAKFVIIDSIQTMHDGELSSASGTVSQVRGCTSVLALLAKNKGIPIFIVGHVTKDGAIAGPKVLEHMVDTVLYFEGDRNHTYRILRAVKNRFGSTDELGIFEMREEGLMEVPNPSEAFLAERPEDHSGSVVTATVEGTRPILVEIQSLVSPSYFSSPRRMASGVDLNKMLMILAVLEKRVGLSVGAKDVYVNVAGGVKIVEPACDLAVAVAVASSLLDVSLNPDLIVIGEVGLAGEVRTVGQIEKRLKEAARLGFKKAVFASQAFKKLPKDIGIEAIGVSSVKAAIDKALSS